MKIHFMKYTMLLASLLLVILIAGCTSTGTNGFSGSATANPAATAANNNSAPLVPLIVMLQGQAGEKNSISLQISEINAQYIDNRGKAQWQKIADAKDLANSQPALPFIVSDKAATALLARVDLPQRKYQQIAFKLQTAKTFLLQDDKKVPLEFSTLMLPTPDWTLAESGNNLLTINIDASNVTIEKQVAKLAENALTVATSLATGSIQLKLKELPKSPVTLAVAWGKSDKAFSPAVNLAEDLSFTVSNLPTGQYRLILNSDEYQFAEELEPIMVTDGIIDAGEIQLQAKSSEP